MKTAELIEIGIEEDTAKKLLAMNGRDIEHAKSEKDKEIATIAAERDGLQSQLDTATTALKKFEGIDPEQIQNELQSYKTQAEETEKRFSRELMQRDQKDWITAKLDEYGVRSPLARRQITAEVMSETDGLKWQPAKDGKPAAFYGFDDYMKAAKTEDASLYQTAEEKAAAEKAAEAEKKAPTFTAPTTDPETGSKKFMPPRIF